MITEQEIRVIKKMLARTREKTDPLAAKVGANHPDQKSAIAAQNVLRDCMTVIMNECAPFTDALPIDVAVRMASYAISVLPIEQQETALNSVLILLPEAHARRMRQGIHIDTDWVTDGVHHKNVPGKGDVN